MAHGKPRAASGAERRSGMAPGRCVADQRLPAPGASTGTAITATCSRAVGARQVGASGSPPNLWVAGGRITSRYEPGRLSLPQSHNFRLDQGWIAGDEIKEVRIDGIEAVAESHDGSGDV